MAILTRTHRQRIGFLGVIGALLITAPLAACASAAAPDGTTSRPDASDSDSSTAQTDSDLAVIGTWSSEEPGNPHLTFETNGDVRGTDGCNRISSTFTVEGDRVTIAPYTATMIGCPGIDDWLRAVSEVAIDGNTMQVFNKRGVEIGTLSRDD